jgi:hypothetical protein
VPSITGQSKSAAQGEQYSRFAHTERVLPNVRTSLLAFGAWFTVAQ